MLKNQSEFEILVNGKSLKEYLHEGKTFVEGREGTRFSLRFCNNSSKRKLFVPSIDGLSVMNGEKASFESNGYIVRPHSAITIDGWRVSDKEVNEFFFSEPKEAYATKTKNGENLGVIGCVVFDEKELLVPMIIEKYIHVRDHTHDHCNRIYCHKCYRFHRPCDDCMPYHTWYFSNGNGGSSFTITNLSANTTIGNSSTNIMDMQSTPTKSALKTLSIKRVSQDLGTGWGETKRSEVTTVEFEREGNPAAMFEIYYNTREQLEAAGVDLKKEAVYVTPQAFPGQYCKPPQN